MLDFCQLCDESNRFTFSDFYHNVFLKTSPNVWFNLFFVQVHLLQVSSADVQLVPNTQRERDSLLQAAQVETVIWNTLRPGMHHMMIIALSHFYSFTFCHFDTFTDQHILVYPVGSDVCVPSGYHRAWRQVTESTGDNMIIVLRHPALVMIIMILGDNSWWWKCLMIIWFFSCTATSCSCLIVIIMMVIMIHGDENVWRFLVMIIKLMVRIWLLSFTATYCSCLIIIIMMVIPRDKNVWW